jgi:hypothetical protein
MNENEQKEESTEPSVLLLHPLILPSGIRIIPSWWTWEQWKADILREYRLQELEKQAKQRQWQREMHGDWR